VGVDGDAGDAEGVAQHDVGGLAADAGQGDEVLQPPGTSPVERSTSAAPSLSRESVLARKKPVGPDLLDLGAVGPGIGPPPSGIARTASGSPG
jgi:hypothetical protein